MSRPLQHTRLGYWVCAAVGVALLPSLPAAGDVTSTEYHKTVQPILGEFCYDCHGDGAKKGNVAFDELAAEGAGLAKPELWLAVLKNLRAGTMPPPKKDKPSAEQVKAIEQWIKYRAFGIDPANPDPGRVTLRRLNRTEYANTIRDLMGYEFRADEEFPPDDTGYGFDNIGDVLTVSPLLLEKYMQAAETIVEKAVPTVARTIKRRELSGSDFRSQGGFPSGQRLSFYREAKVGYTANVDTAGEYRFTLTFGIQSSFNFDPGKARVVFKSGDTERFNEELAWGQKKDPIQWTETLQPGKHRLEVELTPLLAADKKVNSVDLQIVSLVVEGPTDPKHWVATKNYERFFPRAEAPADFAGRKAYAREVLAAFARKAWRRPVEERTIDRLVGIAEQTWGQDGKTFEEGVRRAMVAVLASPRFVFLVEGAAAGATAAVYPLLDEHSLAARLSYFLWSTTPDDELSRLADRGELRKNLPAQMKRMLADGRSDQLVKNFVGQWLQARDAEGVSLNPRSILQREGKYFIRTQDADKRFRDLRTAMRRETEMFFDYVLHQDRSALDLIDSDYTFLNEALADHYGVPGVEGREMRRVTLPKDSVRGGVLTQGTTLIVTSNPTRTSPVKRGQFILENILDMPQAPPPANTPDLEEAAKHFKGREPTVREMLAIHREDALCASCHNRMDPPGLALENFNAMGGWREKEAGQPIDPTGTLITGEKFTGIKELKQILKANHRLDFYRCLSEKLMTYALGRGLEYYDVDAVDRIVDALDREGGRMSVLVEGVINSAPFQHRRNVSAAPESGQRAQVEVKP